jgi:hypothetical protein
MKMRGAAAVAVALAGAAATLAECRASTEVTLDLETDVPCKNLNGTVISAGRDPESVENAAPFVTTAYGCTNGDDGGSIGTFVLVPGGAKDAPLAVRLVAGVTARAEDCVAGRADAGCVVARRALNYLPHTPLTLRIDLRQDCVDRPCDPMSTCVRGACVSSSIDPNDCRGSGCDERALDAGATDGRYASDDGGTDGEAIDANGCVSFAPPCGGCKPNEYCCSADGSAPRCSPGFPQDDAAACINVGLCSRSAECTIGGTCCLQRAGRFANAYCVGACAAGATLCSNSCDCDGGCKPAVCSALNDLPIYTCGGACP